MVEMTENEQGSSESMLSVENITLSFGAVRAIRDVSFDIKRGEIRAIIGPNGAGKTSMLNVINGFYHLMVIMAKQDQSTADRTSHHGCKLQPC